MADKRYLPNDTDDVGLLTCLIEECSEVIQIACKMQRFGWLNWHPDDKQRTPNSTLLLREMDDLRLSIARLERRIQGESAQIKGGGGADG